MTSTEPLSQESIQVLRELNPWWGDPPVVRPTPPRFRRRAILDLAARLTEPRGLVEIIRGPRQVGKTTGLHQIVEELLRGGARGADILFVRFDLELLREEPASLRRILRWFATEVRGRPLHDEAPAYVLLDEVHKLRRWQDEVKHAGDTFPLRMVLTGSSSVLVARGGRESLAGRAFTTELPVFSFREVLECWQPELARALPPPIRFTSVFDGALDEWGERFSALPPTVRARFSKALEGYWLRGGYPRLHSGEVGDDRWADYLVQTIFENVLGADIPDLFPVENPGLLRSLYLAVARLTGQEIAQGKLAQSISERGIPTNQPTVGRYLHYLSDALLIREFRRYPLAKKASARVPAKITVTDLGVRNAIFRGAPSLWTSDPQTLGPLVETLVQGCIRDHNLQVHFFRDFADPRDRRSRVHEVDFVAERIDGEVLPVEVKFRKRIDAEDLAGLRHFRSCFDSKLSVLVTRDSWKVDPAEGQLSIPLVPFLLAF
ncbi:MAG TPA: ATP-binding protein [Thermoanaerobaculia bacterium]|nr:ATP-binding protein [Thermoanaerobaculia bacterium]